jgi:hypothetical protein
VRPIEESYGRATGHPWRLKGTTTALAKMEPSVPTKKFYIISAAKFCVTVTNLSLSASKEVQEKTIKGILFSVSRLLVTYMG